MVKMYPGQGPGENDNAQGASTQNYHQWLLHCMFRKGSPVQSGIEDSAKTRQNTVDNYYLGGNNLSEVVVRIRRDGISRLGLSLVSIHDQFKVRVHETAKIPAERTNGATQ